MTRAVSPILASLALEEFALRRANWRNGLNAGAVPRTAAEEGIARWAAIACYFGAELPAELRDSEGTTPTWIEFYPPTQRVDLSMKDMAEELRRATTLAITRYQAAPTKADLRARVLRLIRLDSHLHYRAGLPPLVIEGPLSPELDALERRAA